MKAQRTPSPAPPRPLLRAPQKLPFKYYLLRLVCAFKKHQWLKNTTSWKKCRRCQFEYGRRPKFVGAKDLVEAWTYRPGGVEFTGEYAWVDNGDGTHSRRFVPDPDYVPREPKKGFWRLIQEQRAKARAEDEQKGRDQRWPEEKP